MADIIMKGKIATTPKIKCSKNAVACCRFVFEKEKKDGFFETLSFGKLCDTVLKKMEVGDGVTIEGNIKSFSFYDADGTCLYGCFVELEKIIFNGGSYIDRETERHTIYINSLQTDNVLPVPEHDYNLLNECSKEELLW